MNSDNKNSKNSKQNRSIEKSITSYPKKEHGESHSSPIKPKK